MLKIHQTQTLVCKYLLVILVFCDWKQGIFGLVTAGWIKPAIWLINLISVSGNFGRFPNFLTFSRTINQENDSSIMKNVSWQSPNLYQHMSSYRPPLLSYHRVRCNSSDSGAVFLYHIIIPLTVPPSLLCLTLPFLLLICLHLMVVADRIQG